MTDTEREEVIRSVILALLGEDLVRVKSLLENMEEAVASETTRAALSRVGGKAQELPAHYAAIEAIVNRMDLSQETVDFAVLKCLEIYEKNKSTYFSLATNDSLMAATRLISYDASRSVIEKVVGAIAENGWYGRIEVLANKFLGRGLTANEVRALVWNYVNDKACQSSDTEEQLLGMARKYMSAKEAREVDIQIKDFVTKVKRYSDGY